MFTALVAIVTGIAFGSSGFKLFRLNDTLKEGGRDWWKQQGNRVEACW
jgi:hypothetical protein